MLLGGGSIPTLRKLANNRMVIRAAIIRVIAVRIADIHGKRNCHNETTEGGDREMRPTKKDCQMLDAIMKAAKQIHAEFDCLSDHVMTKRQIREQIAAIIWAHIERVSG